MCSVSHRRSELFTSQASLTWVTCSVSLWRPTQSLHYSWNSLFSVCVCNSHFSCSFLLPDLGTCFSFYQKIPFPSFTWRVLLMFQVYLHRFYAIPKSALIFLSEVSLLKAIIASFLSICHPTVLQLPVFCKPPIPLPVGSQVMVLVCHCASTLNIVPEYGRHWKIFCLMSKWTNEWVNASVHLFSTWVLFLYQSKEIPLSLFNPTSPLRD